MIGGARGKGSCEEVEEPGYNLAIVRGFPAVIAALPLAPCKYMRGNDRKGGPPLGSPCLCNISPWKDLWSASHPSVRARLGPEKGELRTGIRSPRNRKGAVMEEAPEVTPAEVK